MIKLDNRLQTLYNMVRHQSKVIDVGADHGYLISKLILDNKCPSGKCIDINLKCLEKAQALANKYNLNNKISFLLSNGLSEVFEQETDDIVIAGMGSIMIINIIDNCNWIKNKNDKYLILQPMIKPWVLRNYLYKNGFKIIDENIIIENNFFYVAIGAKYDGQIKPHSIVDDYIGTLLDHYNPNTTIYLSYLAKKLEIISKQILSSGKDIKKYNQYKIISNQIKNIIK